MNVRGFLQIVPDRSSSGHTRSLAIQRVTQRCPRDPLPGAIVVKVILTIPEEIANVQTVEAAVEAGLATVVLEAPE